MVLDRVRGVRRIEARSVELAKSVAPVRAVIPKIEADRIILGRDAVSLRDVGDPGVENRVVRGHSLREGLDRYAVRARRHKARIAEIRVVGGQDDGHHVALTDANRGRWRTRTGWRAVASQERQEHQACRIWTTHRKAHDRGRRVTGHGLRYRAGTFQST